MKLKIENYRYIKLLELPAGWKENTPTRGIATAVVRNFTPPDTTGVEINLFCRGLPLSEAVRKSFREVLKLAPKLIFDCNSASKPSAVDTQLICNLEEVLGNVGNNQIANTETGFSGPPFKLERLDTLVWNGKPLLAARGWFSNPENGKRLNSFCGFFIDANPSQAACNVEQIYLQVEKENLYLQYLPQFQECLQSLVWI